MRRIIERVVTVVTTTTWTISWKDDALSLQPDADPSAEIWSDAAQATQDVSTVIETKEADVIQQEKVNDSPVDVTPHDPKSYPSKNERK